MKSLNSVRMRSAFRRFPLLISTIAMAAPFGLVLSGAGTAQAALGPCRSDPVVILSNLKTLDLSATISDSSSDLHGVTYTMHMPANVHPLLVIPTDGLVGQVEHFKSYSDEPAGTYTVTTNASTGATVPVTATALGILSKSAQVSGWSNEDLTVKL